MKELTIYIFGVIGDEYTSQMLFNQLQQTDDDTEIKVLINSPGGYVYDGLAIYNILKDRDVTVEVSGQASSIASVIAMAGKQVNINENSFMLIHNPWTFAIGDSKYLEKVKNDLDMLKEAILAAYMSRSNLSKEKLVDMMNDETLMSADMALEHGFVNQKIRRSAKDLAMNYLNFYEQKREFAKENRLMKFFDKIKALLGFGDDVTEDQALEKIKALKEAKDSAGNTPRDPQEPQGGNSDKELMTLIRKQNETIQNLQTEIKEIKDTSANDRVENLVQGAVDDGKILPADKDAWLAAAEKDFDGTKEKLDGRAKNSAMPSGVETPSGEQGQENKPKTRAELDQAFKDRLAADIEASKK